MTVKQWAARVHALAKAKGWWPSPVLTPDEILSRLMLVVSELSEACEAVRSGDPHHYINGTTGKPEGFAVELADAVLRIMDLTEGLAIDIEARMAEKHAYNETRPHRHGRVV